VSAHDELRQLLQRYARAADERDVDGLRTLFHPEAEIDGVRGLLPLDAWLETMRGPQAFPVSMHLMGEPLIVLDPAAGDRPPRASLDTYAVVFQVGDRDAGQGDMTIGMRYRDEAVLHDGGWVFQRRTTTTLWMH
jgi:hypothetical protein